MRLDIFSDTVCPWCFVGKRRLERALEERPIPGLAITWRAFQLNPEMPLGGMERQAYLSAKFGGPARARKIYDSILEASQGENLPFAFEAIERTPNTVASHRLIRFAQERDPLTGTAVVERLFRGYFLEGKDIGDVAILADLAAEAGMDRNEVEAFLASDAGQAEVQAEDALARRIGINGVPTFILNDRHVLSGAHLPEVLHQFFDIGRQELEAV